MHYNISWKAKFYNHKGGVVKEIKMLHQSIDGDKRYTIDFGERRRVKDNCEKYGIRNKKKHKLRQKRRAIENTKNYYGENADAEILKQAETVVNQELFKQYKETEE